MRVTEFIHWINRTDLKLGRRPSEHEYTHLTLTTKIKRARYLHQCAMQGKKPVDGNEEEQ